MFFTDNDPARRATLPPFQRNPRLNNPALYQPSPELQDAVSVALTLGLPLLLTGEPGTGKTELAAYIAWYFQLGDPIRFNVQTTSGANDLFYHYDALAHFQYSQNNPDPLDAAALERRFIRYRALGQAIVSGQRRVVLLDEIDKAPRDLPNDVLAALEDLEFYVPELDKWQRTDDAHRPVIVMTSNTEKNLPDAFLRRVVYFNIEFPGPDKLLQIVAAKVKSPEGENADAADRAFDAGLQHLVDHFDDLREDKDLKWQKKPATAELIQWAYYLKTQGFDPAQLEQPARLGADARRVLLGAYSILAKTREDLAALRKRLR